MYEITNTYALLKVATKEALYIALVRQINKDFELSNITKTILETQAPELMVIQLENYINELILEDFDLFLNFLYRVDLSENKVKKVIAQQPNNYLKHVTFLIVKREWQKVWLRQQYS